MQNNTIQQRFTLVYNISLEHSSSITGLHYAKYALDLADSLESELNRAASLELIGTHQRLLGNKLAALTATLAALQIYEQHTDKEHEIASIYVQLGEHAVIDKDYSQAINYLQKGVELHGQLNNIYQVAVAQINLGEAYRLTRQYDSAIQCFQKALELRKQFKGRHLKQRQIVYAYAIGNLGMVSYQLGDLRQALGELQAAIEVLTDLNDMYSMSIYQAEIGRVYERQREFKLAEKQFLQAVRLAKKERFKEQIRDVSKLLVSFYESQNNYPKALKYQKVYQIYQDSLVNHDNVQQLERLKANYEIEKKETEVKYLVEEKIQQKQISYGLAIGISLLLFLVIGLVWSYYNAIKQRDIIKQSEEEKVLLLQELNHRVKNNLQMISSLLNLQARQFKDHPANEALTAGRLRVEALSLIHQKLYQENLHTQIAVQEYISTLVYNLRAVYNEQIGLKLQIEDIEININVAIPLALIVNELVINSFKYAFVNISRPHLQLELHKHQNYLQLIIADNGVGVETALYKEKQSFGLRLVESLVQQLNGEIKMHTQGGCIWRIHLELNEYIY